MAAQAKVALVTGAAKRIGRTIALDLASAGWRVAVHHRASAAEAAEVVATIRKAGGVAEAYTADLADSEAVDRLIPAAASALGPLSLLVNNASLFLSDDVGTLDHARWRQHQGVNLEAAVFLAKALADQLPSGVDGHVINIIDQRVLKPTPVFFSYGVSKAGLNAATAMLAQALAPRVRVNAIGPGPVLQSVHQSEAEFATEAQSTLLGHGTSPEEIAAAIRFLVGSPAVTGQLLIIDGGQHLAWKLDDGSDIKKGTHEPKRPVEQQRIRRPLRSVIIDGLTVETIIGIHAFEKLKPQKVIVSITLSVEETGTPGSDRFEDVVDYESLVNAVRTIALAGNVTLLETMAERIAAVCFPDRRIVAARIKVEKPDIFADCRSVGIEIERFSPHSEAPAKAGSAN